MSRPKKVKPAPPVEIVPELNLPEGRCGSCKFADKDPEGRYYCRRYPAQLVLVPQGLVALFPVVDLEKDWCGEYAPLIRTSH